jgi:Cu/Ag efflux protein CusF
LLISPPSRLGTGFPTWLLVTLMAALSVSCGEQQPRADNAAEPTPQAANASPSPIPWATIEPPAQVPAPADTPNAQQPSAVKSYSGTGIIRLINLKEGWLEIDHEEIKGFMAAMQMEWSVKDRAMLKRVRVGDKVDFTLEDNNGSEVITGLKKVRTNR